MLNLVSQTVRVYSELPGVWFSEVFGALGYLVEAYDDGIGGTIVEGFPGEMESVVEFLMKQGFDFETL